MSKHSNKQENTEPAGQDGGVAQPAADNAADTPAAASGQEAAKAESGAASVAAGDAASGTGSGEQLVEELQAKLAASNDQFLRKAADFENFRKRVNREKQELTDFANQNLILDLLPVLDDFERAIKSAETSKDFASFYEGIIMIQKQLASQLENKWGLKPFNSAGELFDPNRHEAIQMEKTAGINEAVVKEDYVKGYCLKERVIRCAKVKVLMPEETPSPAITPGEEGAPNEPPPAP